MSVTDSQGGLLCRSVKGRDFLCLRAVLTLVPVSLLAFSFLCASYSHRWPYYDETDTETIQKTVLRGEPPYLNPLYRTRSLIEQRMTEIMDRCHVLDYEGRVDIFEVVRHLRETKQMVKNAAADPTKQEPGPTGSLVQ